MIVALMFVYFWTFAMEYTQFPSASNESRGMMMQGYGSECFHMNVTFYPHNNKESKICSRSVCLMKFWAVMMTTALHDTLNTLSVDTVRFDRLYQYVQQLLLICCLANLSMSRQVPHSSVEE